MERTSGDGILAYLPQTRGVLEIPPGEPTLGVSVNFSSVAFLDQFAQLIPALRKIGFGDPTTTQCGNRPFYRQSRFGHQAFYTLKQILECPYRGGIRTAFLEAKSLELVVLKLAELIANEAPTASDMTPRDLDRVREAHHILLERMEQPPTLADLCRAVGINRNKLNSGFKRLYGDTVFNTLRNARLSKAWSLLQQTELTLAEIAFAVGYNNQSNFTTAFRRHFGHTPGTVRHEDDVAVSRRRPHLLHHQH